MQRDSRLSDDASFAMADSGEAQLLRQLNRLQTEHDRHLVATGKLELGMKELSHLHAQLNAITTQCHQAEQDH